MYTTYIINKLDFGEKKEKRKIAYINFKQYPMHCIHVCNCAHILSLDCPHPQNPLLIVRLFGNIKRNVIRH